MVSDTKIKILNSSILLIASFTTSIWILNKYDSDELKLEEKTSHIIGSIAIFSIASYFAIKLYQDT